MMQYWDPIQALFFSTDIGGYFGPILLIAAGIYLGKRDKILGTLFIIVEMLCIYQYAKLLSSTPDYWWQIVILLLGVIVSTFRIMTK